MVKKYARWASRLELPVLLAGALLVAFITCFVQPVAAQESRATVRGVITDPTHAVVPGAKVTLHNVATNIDVVKDADSSGFYVFDQVISGTYTLSVEATGFQKFVQENIRAQATGDITVNAVLALGSVTQTVEVTAAVGQVEFNTSNMSVTVQNSYLRDLPILARNPFSLAMLDAGVINQYWDMSHRLPFYMWSDGGMDIGGPTGGKNEQIIDGTRTDIASRGTYNAPMDAVQEVVVQQNIPDSEHGFSSGGAINITMKSGTNDFHGSAYVMTRQPPWNALANRVTRTPDIVKQNIWGLTIGNPVFKNKLFNFFAWEHWYATQPSSVYETMPDAAERTGDFRNLLTAGGKGPRNIYDPTSTLPTPPYTRTQISCNGVENVICPNLIDPTAAKLMTYMWYPNTSPDDPDGLNNFKVTYPWWTKYHNFSDRVDYNLSDKWRMYAHYSAFRTRLDNVNWSAGYMNGGPPSIATPSDNGGIMDATSSGMDVLYMPSPRTTLDIRLGVNYEEDDYNSTWSKVPLSVWAGLWPNDTSFNGAPWYSCCNNPIQGVYFPDFEWDGLGTGGHTGFGGWWYDHLRDYEPSVTVTHEIGKHHMKIGWYHRYAYNQAQEDQGTGYWYFNSQDTAFPCVSCGQAYTVADSGDPWASGLLGILNSGFAEKLALIDSDHYQMDAFFIQDDFRLTPRATLNLGIRWERETGPSDTNHWDARTLDLKQSIPGFYSPSTFNLWTPQVLSVVQGLAAANPAMNVNAIPTLQQPIFNGALLRATPGDSRYFDAPYFTLLPRIGIAYRLTDKMALRFGWSRFGTPNVMNRGDESVDPKNGWSQTTYNLGSLLGIPRSYLYEPFPNAAYSSGLGAGGNYVNTIIPAVGDALGPYQDLGNSITYWNGRDYVIPMNDRFNFNIQRQLPAQFRLDVTEFIMFTRNAEDCTMWGCVQSKNMNQMNPMFNYTYKSVLTTPVPNPFYGQVYTSLAQAGLTSVPASYTGEPIMPGSLGTSPTVSLSQLLQPYPQYGTLTEMFWPGRITHYYGTALSITRPMSHGWTFLGTYNYSLDNRSTFYDDIDTYNNKYTMADYGNPRHNIRLSGTYQVPFGRGRQYFSSAPRWVDEIIGGWATSNIFYWVSGTLLGFPTTGMICNPRYNVPKGMWFNANCITTAPAYTIPTDPLYYEGIRGPHFWDLDTTAVKNFRITESMSLEFRLEMYNMPNIFIPSNPNVCSTAQCGNIAGIPNSVASSSNGANYGRELQCSVRFHF
jgi:hypothetical protein